MPPCRLTRSKFWKFVYEMVHSEVYLNKYVVSIAPFSHPYSENCFFACFRFFIFDPFSRGVSWPHLPLCADADVRKCHMPCRVAPFPMTLIKWAETELTYIIFKRCTAKTFVLLVSLDLIVSLLRACASPMENRQSECLQGTKVFRKL